MYSSRNTNPRQTWDSSFAGSRDKSQSQRWSSEWLQHSHNCHALPKAPSCIGALKCVAYALAFKEALQIDRIVWYTCISTKQRNFLHHRVLRLKPTSERRARSIALRTPHMGGDKLRASVAEPWTTVARPSSECRTKAAASRRGDGGSFANPTAKSKSCRMSRT
jgi:hypothetical protein